MPKEKGCSSQVDSTQVDSRYKCTLVEAGANGLDFTGGDQQGSVDITGDLKLLTVVVDEIPVFTGATDTLVEAGTNGLGVTGENQQGSVD